MLFSNLFTTSAYHPLCCLRLYSVVWHILLVVPFPGGEFSAHPWYSHRLSCLEATRGIGETDRNFLCNVGATQPIGTFLPPPSCKSMQLCGFDILPPSCISTQLCGLGIINSFHYGPCNGSPPFPPSSPLSFSLHSSLAWLFGWVVCRHRMCSSPCIHLLRTPRHILCSYPQLSLPVLPLNKNDPTSVYIFPARNCLHLNLPDFFRFFPVCGVRHTNFSSTMYTFVVSEEHLESTTIYLAHELCSISFCQSICPQALGNVCDSVGSSPPSIQFVTVRLLHLGFVHNSQVDNLEILSSEVGCLVEVTFVGKSQLLLIVYGSINIFSPLFQLPCSSVSSHAVSSIPRVLLAVFHFKFYSTIGSTASSPNIGRIHKYPVVDLTLILPAQTPAHRWAIHHPQQP